MRPLGFMLIMTESNDKQRQGPLQSTTPSTLLSSFLPAKHKFTGDYLQYKKISSSIRDGKDPSRILFFVHFEKTMDLKVN